VGFFSEMIAREDVVFTDLDNGTAVLLNLETKYYFSLNETGCFLWKILDKPAGASEAELVTELTREFDVDPERAKADIADFVKELVSEGLIKKD